MKPQRDYKIYCEDNDYMDDYMDDVNIYYQFPTIKKMITKILKKYLWDQFRCKSYDLDKNEEAPSLPVLSDWISDIYDR